MKFFKKYKNLIWLFILTTFLNLNYVYFYNWDYMFCYLYFNDYKFNYIIFKLILPAYCIGMYISRMQNIPIIDLLGYQKAIKLVIISLGFSLILLSYNNTILLFLVLSWIIGYLQSLLAFLIHNLCYTLYPKKINYYEGFISGGWVLSFIPISIISQYIINPKGLNPKFIKVINNINYSLYSEEISNTYPNFLFIYGIFILCFGSLISHFIDNPKGFNSRLSIYINNKINRNKDKYFYNEFELVKQEDRLSYKLELKENLIDKNSFKSTKWIELSDKTLNLNNIEYEKKIDKLLNDYTINKYLKSKNFWILFLNFILIYSIYIISCLNLKMDGSKYYDESFILKTNNIFLFLNFFGRIITSKLVKIYEIKNWMIKINLCLIFSLVWSLFKIPLISYMFSNILLLFTVGVGINHMRISCKKLYHDQNITIPIQNYMESACLYSSIFEFIIEIIWSKYMKFEIIIIFNLILNIMIISNYMVN